MPAAAVGRRAGRGGRRLRQAPSAPSRPRPTRRGAGAAASGGADAARRTAAGALGATAGDGGRGPTAGLRRCGSRERAGGQRSRPAPASTSTSSGAQTAGEPSTRPVAARLVPGRSRNGALRPSPTCSSRWPGGGGSSASTGAASIFSVRQTVCASARVKVASGSSSKRSASSSLELARRDLDRRGQRRDVQALAWRAWRSRPPAVAAAPPAARRPGRAHSSNCPRSKADRLARLGEAAAQLVAQLAARRAGCRACARCARPATASARWRLRAGC